MDDDVLCPYNRSHVVPRVSYDLNSSFYIKPLNKLNNEAAKVLYRNRRGPSVVEDLDNFFVAYRPLGRSETNIIFLISAYF